MKSKEKKFEIVLRFVTEPVYATTIMDLKSEAIQIPVEPGPEQRVHHGRRRKKTGWNIIHKGYIIEGHGIWAYDRLFNGVL